jgi:hypothetical protein
MLKHKYSRCNSPNITSELVVHAALLRVLNKLHSGFKNNSSGSTHLTSKPLSLDSLCCCIKSCKATHVTSFHLHQFDHYNDSESLY